MIQLCRHIRPEGTQCTASALRNARFCHTHERLHAEGGPADAQSAVELLFPEDRVAIQTNLFRISSALAAGRIDLGTANAMTYNMRAALSNLGQRPLLPASSPTGESAPAQLVARVILTPEGDRIAPPVEVPEPGESEPIHHRACPCLACAGKYRNWPGELHHADCDCGLCEPLDETALVATAPREFTATRLRRATAAALLSPSAARDPLSRPWSVADYTFGDSIRRHEAQYAARAAAALAAGIEPPPYQHFDTGLLDPSTEEAAVERERQQRADQLWSEHFQSLLEQKQPAAAAPESGNENESDPAPPAAPGQLSLVQAHSATTNGCPIHDRLHRHGWESTFHPSARGLEICHSEQSEEAAVWDIGGRKKQHLPHRTRNGGWPIQAASGLSGQRTRTQPTTPPPAEQNHDKVRSTRIQDAGDRAHEVQKDTERSTHSAARRLPPRHRSGTCRAVAFWGQGKCTV